VSPAETADIVEPSADTDQSEGPLLLVEDLHTTFRVPAGTVRAVDGVSLRLERGRTLGIVGESGSGKSVLSRSIMGLTPANAVRSGSVKFDGVELLGKPEDELRDYWGTQISMVFQDPMTALNPVMRVGNQITEPLRVHLGMSRADATATAIRLIESVGIPEPTRRLRQYPHEMSGGMRQRIMIAIALACGPRLLLADEPTTALDVTVQAQILDLLQAQQQDRFMAMVLVTHDLGVVAGRADEIAVMYAGRVVERAATTSLFRHTRHPYTEALLRSIPRLENPSHTRLAAITGRPPNLLDPPPGCKFAARCPYVRDRCRAQEPPLLDDGNGHEYRCWFPVDLDARDVAGVAIGETVTDTIQIATTVEAQEQAAAEIGATTPDANGGPPDAQGREPDGADEPGPTAEPAEPTEPAGVARSEGEEPTRAEAPGEAAAGTPTAGVMADAAAPADGGADPTARHLPRVRIRRRATPLRVRQPTEHEDGD
jgi:oligopeptide/dipeptide ABC transporter ATP-binding protein